MQWYLRLERRSGLWRQWLPATVPNESSHRTHKHGYTKYRAKQTAKKEKKRSRYTKLFTFGRLGCHCLNRAGTRMVHRGRVKGMLRSGASPGSLRACRRGGWVLRLGRGPTAEVDGWLSEGVASTSLVREVSRCQGDRAWVCPRGQRMFVNDYHDECDIGQYQCSRCQTHFLRRRRSTRIIANRDGSGCRQAQTGQLCQHRTDVIGRNCWDGIRKN